MFERPWVRLSFPGTQAVMVHQLSKKSTQNPFRKNKGRVVAVLFHHKNPLFFVASANHVRVYNLVRAPGVRPRQLLHHHSRQTTSAHATLPWCLSLRGQA